jgi:TPR repeat protein
MQYFNHPGSSFYKWPHQKPEQAVAAALFFPQELVDPDENDAVLYGRPHIQELLAYSAKYEDPLALYHLSRVLESYSIGEEDIIAQRSDALLESAQKKEVDLEGDEEGLPYYFAGQLFSLLGDKEKAERAFRKGDGYGDGRATYQLALLTESQEEKIRLYNRSRDLGYQKALLGLARTADNLDKQFDYYWKAGEAGIAEGYYELGNMVGRRGYRYQGEEQAKQYNNSIEYFKKAGDLGLLSAYSKAAQGCLEAGQRQEALELYSKQTIEGGLGLDDVDKFTSLLKENGEEAVRNLYQQYRTTLLGSFLEEHFPGLATEEKGSRSFDADYFNGLADIALKQGGDEDEAMDEAT